VHHNELCGELCDMVATSFAPSVVRIELKIRLWCAANDGTCKPIVMSEDRLDVLVLIG
jgi:hypothetical protein